MPIPADKREIRILTENMVDADSTIVVSAGGTTANLFDRDKDNKYITSGVRRDTQAATIEVTFNVGTVETEFTLNTLIMLKTNVKLFKLEWFDSAESIFKTIIETERPGEITCLTFGAVKTSKIRLTLFTTQQPNREKEIGELIIARQRFILSDNPSSYDLVGREKKTIIELGDGQRHIAYTRFSDQRISKYGARVSFRFLPQADYDILECIKNEGTPFLWYPESLSRPLEIYKVNWVNPFETRYSIQFKGAGYDITMELEEV